MTQNKLGDSTELQADDKTFLDQIESLVGEELPELNATDPWRILNKGYIVRDGQVIGLNLAGVEMEELPRFVLEFTKLEELYLRDTGLTKLQSKMLDLENLKHLFLPGTALGVFPHMLTEMKNLERLTLNGGEIDSVPDLRDMHNLEQLYLSRNQIKFNEEFVDHLKSNRKLKLLALTENGIKSLPQNIHILSGTSLEKLVLSNNNLASLSDTFASGLTNVSTLRELDLSDNQLEELPPNFSSLASLDFVDLRGNKFETKPQVLEEMGSSVKIEFDKADQADSFLSNF